MGIFSMPHTEIDYIKQSKISIYIDRNGIDWDGEIVKIVFFFALNKQVKPNINQIYEYFNDLVSDVKLLGRLTHVTGKEEIYQLLRQV